MIRLTLVVLLAFPLAIAAAPPIVPPGTNLTHGSVSSPRLFSCSTNPAAGAVALELGKNRYRVGLLSSAGVRYEIGRIDAMLATLDELSLLLKEITSIEEAEAAIEHFTPLLKQMGEQGYIRIGASTRLPLFPLVITHQSLNGSLLFDASASSQAQLRVLDAALTFDTSNASDARLRTDTALYVKNGVQSEIALGYSGRLASSADGNLYLGGRLKYLRVGLGRSMVRLDLGEEDDTLERFRGEAEDDRRYSNAFGADVGLLWMGNAYSLGATLVNMNAPAFDYARFEPKCGGDTADPVCIHAGRVGVTERHVMHPRLTLDGALYTPERNWVLAAAYDVGPAQDLLGNDLQYVSVGAAYVTDRFGIPGVRLGYRKNLAGTRLEEATFGVTLLRSLTIDMAYGLESVQFDDQRLPRSAALKIGLEVSF